MKYYGMISAVFVCAFMVACSKHSGEQVESNTGAISVPVEAEQAEPVRAKPGLSVALAQSQQRIEVGVPTEIDLSLTTDIAEGILSVTLTLPDGLQLINGVTTQQFDLSTERPRISLQVYAEQSGKYYIPLVAELDRGQHRGRVVSAIIWAGDMVQLRAQQAPDKSDSDGIIELPARETVY